MGLDGRFGLDLRSRKYELPLMNDVVPNVHTITIHTLKKKKKKELWFATADCYILF
jgi:hypothetical protein